MLPPPNQGAVLPHFLDTMIGHAVHDTLLVSHVEAEMGAWLLLHFIWRHIHQLAAHMVEVADLEFAAPEFRVPVDAIQQFLQRDHAFLPWLIQTNAMQTPFAVPKSFLVAAMP